MSECRNKGCGRYNANGTSSVSPAWDASEETNRIGWESE